MPSKAKNFIPPEAMKNFRFLCSAFAFLYPENRYEIEETWLDVGAEMRWETIVCYNRPYGAAYQMLSPAEWDRIVREDDIVNLTQIAIKIAREQEVLLK